jgi:hypothetical protein
MSVGQLSRDLLTVSETAAALRLLSAASIDRRIAEGNIHAVSGFAHSWKCSTVNGSGMALRID